MRTQATEGNMHGGGTPIAVGLDGSCLAALGFKVRECAVSVATLDKLEASHMRVHRLQRNPQMHASHWSVESLVGLVLVPIDYRGEPWLLVDRVIKAASGRATEQSGCKSACRLEHGRLTEAALLGQCSADLTDTITAQPEVRVPRLETSEGTIQLDSNGLEIGRGEDAVYLCEPSLDQGLAGGFELGIERGHRSRVI